MYKAKEPVMATDLYASLSLSLFLAASFLAMAALKAAKGSSMIRLSHDGGGPLQT